VHLLVFEETPLGYNAIVNNAHTGLLYRSEVSVPLLYGQPIDGYVRTVRPDGKIDLRLDPAGYQRVAPLTETIIEALQKNGGQLALDDSSSPEEIRQAFATSKKAFKQALGALFRERRIEFTKPGVRLLR
jgi:predicted RNA-binding protein (virulence factor B family)